MSKNGLTPPPFLVKEMDQTTAQQETAQETQLQKQNQQTEAVVWSQERLDLLRKTLCQGLSNEQFLLFAEVCRQRRLNPFNRQVYAVVRQGKLVIQTGIDGYRLIAERTGKYLGQTPTYWCGKDGQWRDIWIGPGNPYAAKIGVYKQGHAEPTLGIAYWDAYVAPGPFWQKSGASQLAKCAEALALRKAFPEELSGLYTDDEMTQAGPIEAEIVEEKPDPANPALVFPASIVLYDPKNAPDGPFKIVGSDGQEWFLPAGSSWTDIELARDKSTFVMIHWTKEYGRFVIDKAVLPDGAF